MFYTQILFHSRFPLWEIYTGGRRTLIRHGSDIPDMKKYIEILKRVLREENLDALLMVGGFLSFIGSNEEYDWHFNNVVVGSTPISKMLIESEKRICKKLMNAYGATEIPWISYKEINPEEEYQDFDSGQPFPGVEVKVVDSKGHLVKRGQRGEILIRPPVPFLGYIDENGKSEKVQTTSGWIALGDSGMVTPGGNLIVEGRIADSVLRASDRLITVSGWEAQLKQHPGVANAVVATFTNHKKQRKIFFAILPKPDVQVSQNELRECMLDSQNRIPDIWDKFLLPENFVFFTSFPMLNTGKVNRKEIVEFCKERLSKRITFGTNS